VGDRIDVAGSAEARRERTKDGVDTSIQARHRWSKIRDA
jgi:hypothetical protein